MRFFRGHQAEQPCVLTIGNFDGLHLGHQYLLKHLVERARERGLPASVLSFEPHPREFFSPSEAPARLTSLREKLLLLNDNGVDDVYIQRFDDRFAALSADSFIQSVLVAGLKVRHLLIGDDFQFGARRDGNFSLLQAVGREQGFETEAMSTLSIAGERASSSAVREALNAGNLRHAAQLLGRHYSIAGLVSRGNQIGRQIGFPTLNIALQHHRPLSGVFVVEVEGVASTSVPGVANVGGRPTVARDSPPRLEVHLLDWSGECYGAHLRVHFLHKLRDERRFASLEALKAQIGLDTRAARDWFSPYIQEQR